MKILVWNNLFFVTPCKMRPAERNPRVVTLTRCLLCLMLGMFRRRAGPHGTLSRKMSVTTWRFFFVCCGATCKLGSTQQKASWSGPGCQCFVLDLILGMLCAPTACQSCDVFHCRREDVALGKLFCAMRVWSVWIRTKVFCSQSFEHRGSWLNEWCVSLSLSLLVGPCVQPQRQQQQQYNQRRLWWNRRGASTPPWVNHALSQVGGPTQSQLSRPMSSRHHISMEHRLRRKHLQINSDVDASNETNSKETQEKTKEDIFCDLSGSQDWLHNLEYFGWLVGWLVGGCRALPLAYPNAKNPFQKTKTWKTEKEKKTPSRDSQTTCFLQKLQEIVQQLRSKKLHPKKNKKNILKNLKNKTLDPKRSYSPLRFLQKKKRKWKKERKMKKNMKARSPSNWPLLNPLTPLPSSKETHLFTVINYRRFFCGFWRHLGRLEEKKKHSKKKKSWNRKMK